MPFTLPTYLSDRELLDATVRTAADERRATVELLLLLAELDVRRLFLGEGCSSLFTFCTQVLHLSEHAAYHRIEAARAARQFPGLLDQLADGALTLTTVALLRPHLTRENHDRLLADARHKTKREVEHQIACLAPKADVTTVLRKVPSVARTEVPALVALAEALPQVAVDATEDPRVTAPVGTSPRATLAPLASDRYVLKVTIGAETHAKLRRAQDLLRHAIPNGDPSAVLDRALTLLVADLERRRIGRVRRPRPARTRGSASTEGSRHVPAAMRRAIWRRDEGRCAFRGPHGRCRETGHLEFHLARAGTNPVPGARPVGMHREGTSPGLVSNVDLPRAWPRHRPPYQPSLRRISRSIIRSDTIFLRKSRIRMSPGSA